MKTISLLFLVIVCTCATEEYADDIQEIIDNPDYLLEIVKRLGNGQAMNKLFPGKHSDSPPIQSYAPTVNGKDRSCKPLEYPKTIIRTEDSRKAGATFLISADNIHTNAECLEKCCSTTDCDLAVYENKTKHNCYLFHCLDESTGENKCQFANHSDYVSTTLTKLEDKTKPDSALDLSETDLGQSLEKATEELNLPPVKPSARPTQLPHSVALGESCQLDVSCEDPHAVCFQDVCQCQHDYTQKYGFCRKVCSSDEFECKIRGTSLVGPDCIPKPQVCDGTTQCADGSDEKDCHTDYQKGGTNTGYNPSQNTWDENPSASQNSDESSAPSAKDETDTADQDEVETGPVPSSDKDSTPSQSSPDLKTNEQAGDDSSAEQGTDNKSQASEESKEAEESSSGEKGAQTDTSSETGESSEENGSDDAPKDKPTPKPENRIVEEESVFVSKEKVIVASPTDNAQGPIVALSLGLAITLMLLIFVGCRLRNVRHRLRKGRPLHSNEADYLINGMYL